MTSFATLTSKNQLTLSSEMVAYAKLPPGTRFLVKNDGNKIILEKIDGLRSLQGVLADHPLSKKYTTDEIISLARKKKIARLYNNGR